jgi:hypothetical protein
VIRRRARTHFIVAVLATFTVAAVGCGGDSSSGGDSRETLAVAKAKAAFWKAQAAGVDLSAGPCIAEQLPGLSDWAADVAHDPRQPVDDDPANQCEAYRSGRADHFVELDPSGAYIRSG